MEVKAGLPSGHEVVPATTMQTLADRHSNALKRYPRLRELARPVAFPASRPPTAGRAFSSASTPYAGMGGWTKLGTVCAFLLNSGLGCRSSCIGPSLAHLSQPLWSCERRGTDMG